MACETFRLGYPDEPVGAARGLVEAVLAPSLAGSKKPSWVEMTPRTVVVAEQLAAMFPEARIVHAVRSGLDVASSVRDAGWGPDDMLEALLWWSDRLIAADAGLAALSVDKRHTVHLEQLVEAETQAQTVADLFRFLGVEETRHTTRFVAARITPEEARVGRWRSGLTEREIDHARALYVLLAGRLRRQGVQPLPVDVDDQAKVHRDLPLVRQRRAMLAARGTLIGRQVAGVRARRQPRRSIGG